MVPSAATDSVSLPTVTLTVGSPNRCASAGVRKIPLCPPAVTVREPSGNTVGFDGPDEFSVMVFPVARLVNENLTEPVLRKVVDPSEVLRILKNDLSTGKLTRILNPQNAADSVKGFAAANCHFGPRASAGPAVTTPPNMPSSALSATTTPSRLMAITSYLPATGCGQRRKVFLHGPHDRPQMSLIWRPASSRPTGSEAEPGAGARPAVGAGASGGTGSQR